MKAIVSQPLILAWFIWPRERGDEAQALYHHAIAEYGKAEARHIGAVDDFYNLAAERPGDKAVAAIATIFENDE